MLCHGYTGVKDLYLPDNARVLNEAGYVVLTFDYKGWGASEGPRSRLAPYSRVADVQAALTFLGLQPKVDPERLGHLRHELWRRHCGLGRRGRPAGQVHRQRRRRWTRARAGCAACAGRTSGTICWTAPRPTGRSACWTASRRWPTASQILLPDRQSAELAAAARRANPAAVNELPLEFIDDTLGFHPEWVVDKIAPRPILFITTDDDRLVPPEESEQLFAKAGEPKKLVILRGFGHYEVYVEPAFSQVMTETTAWFRKYLPPASSPRARRRQQDCRLP